MPRPFVVLSLPRSRSAWLARFLSYNRAVGHDSLIWLDHIEDFPRQFAPSGPLAGTVETAGVLGWRLMLDLMPQAQFLALKRPVQECADSFVRLGIEPPLEDLFIRSQMLEAFSQHPSVTTIQSCELDLEPCVRWLFNSVLDEPFDPAWWLEHRQFNIQVDFAQRQREILSRLEPIAQLKAEVLARSQTLGGPSVCAMH